MKNSEKTSTLSAAVSLITSGAKIFVHGGAATPNALLLELVAQAPRLKDVSLIHLHTARFQMR